MVLCFKVAMSLILGNWILIFTTSVGRAVPINTQLEKRWSSNPSEHQKNAQQNAWKYHNMCRETWTLGSDTSMILWYLVILLYHLLFFFISQSTKRTWCRHCLLLLVLFYCSFGENFCYWNNKCVLSLLRSYTCLHVEDVWMHMWSHNRSIMELAFSATIRGFHLYLEFWTFGRTFSIPLFYFIVKATPSLLVSTFQVLASWDCVVYVFLYLYLHDAT